MSWVQGKVALVTGGAAGLGRAYVQALAAAGADVALCDVRAEAPEVAKAIGAEHGVKAAGWVADVAVPEDVWRVVDATVAELGGVDILINNAGICMPTPVTDDLGDAVAAFDRTFAVNTRGEYLFGRAVMPIMLERGGGQIVNIVTDHCYTEPRRPTVGAPIMDVYDSSKWALNGLTLAWARALEGKIRVNAVSMGATDSNMLRSWTGEDRLTQELIDSWKRPEDVARFILDLLEEGPSGRTGWNLPIWVNDPIVMPELTDDWGVRVGTMQAIG